MFGDEIVFENVEDEFVLSEDLEAEGRLLIIFWFLLQIFDEQGGFAIDAVLFGEFWGYDEEVVDFIAGFEDAVDVVIGDDISFEVVEDGDGARMFFILGFFEWEEEIFFVEEFLVDVEVVELGGSHFFGLVWDEVLTILHDFEDGFVNAVESEGLFFA